MQQVGALPYRIGPDGDVEVLLITSRGSGRWIIPKGNPIKGLKAHQVAAREAFEEAGISGNPSIRSLGRFYSVKQRAGQPEAETEITVYPLLVTEQFQDWPERPQRKRRWLSPIAASHLVEDAGLKRILQIFHLTVET
ncbi:NUDIX hydrolase [Novosphingobium sp. G106]|uniref:NUDIX hydrolase n=1 Tax=Novosphingobium sp. G106 TaxID=2849500 RepID=UPI001C2DE6E1|nr:NUDIX hydrolase [Novosphingobium sp. G106]MBV1692526.1 NUDIX hydrolase [Novosphingobium sp. G106]